MQMPGTQKLITSLIDLKRLNKIENSNSLIQKEKPTAYRLKHYNLPYAEGQELKVLIQIRFVPLELQLVSSKITSMFEFKLQQALASSIESDHGGTKL
jgi:hypothetical protein